jgi:hypothetical protein
MKIVGLLVVAMLIAAAVIVSLGVDEAKAIQNDLYAAVNYARPIAEQAKLAHEQTGKWPASVNEEKKPPQVARVQLLQEQGVRVSLAGREEFVNKSLLLKIVARDGAHYLECNPGDLARGSLPRFCKPDGEPMRLTWPPQPAK